MGMTEDYVEEIKTPEELKSKLEPIYVIEKYTENELTYTNFMDTIYTYLKGCIEKKDCIKTEVQFKFYYKDKKIHTMQFRHFIINVMLWYPFINLHGIPDIMDETYILDGFTQIPYITDYINTKVIPTLQSHSIKNTIMMKSISLSLYYLRQFSVDFSLILGLHIDTEAFIKAYLTNARIREIMESDFSLEEQPVEIEKRLDALMEELIELLKKLPNNVIGIILNSGTGMKNKQLAEFAIAKGLNPDLNGVTIPLPVSNSILIGGSDRPSYHYIDALGARKSLIMNKKVMGKAGYFGKLVLELARTLRLSKSVSDCGAKHLLPIEMKSKKMLKKYNGRYYKLDEHDKWEDLKLLNEKEDKDLIGKTIYFRSPITCCCENDEVCHKCFGATSTLAFDIMDGISAYESEEVTKVINQMILSTKHLLTTISELIQFNEAFSKFFTLTAGEVSPKLQDNDLDLDQWAIWVDPNDIRKAEELDSDSSFNTYIEGTFYVHNLKTKETITIKSDKEREMFLSDEFIENMKKGKGFVKFSDLDESSSLFSIEIMNSELTKPLYDLMDLLDKDNSYTYAEMAQTFTELLLSANIKAMALAGEIIINRLIRCDPDEDYLRPDFGEREVPPYQIYTIKKALKKNPSLFIGISSENIKSQMQGDDFTEVRTGGSYLDPLFKKETSTKRIIKIRNLLKEKNLVD